MTDTTEKEGNERTYVCLWTSCKHFQYHMLCTTCSVFLGPQQAALSQRQWAVLLHTSGLRNNPQMSAILSLQENAKEGDERDNGSHDILTDIRQAGSFVQGADHTCEAGSEKRKAALHPRAASSQAGEATGKAQCVRATPILGAFVLTEKRNMVAASHLFPTPHIMTRRLPCEGTRKTWVRKLWEK